MNVIINDVKYVPEPPKVDLGALSVEFYSDDLDETLSIKEYFKNLLYTLWLEEDGFSGKRPFGNSCWQFPVIYALINAGYIDGWVKYDEDGYPEDSSYDRKTAEQFILDLIISM